MRIILTLFNNAPSYRINEFFSFFLICLSFLFMIKLKHDIWAKSLCFLMVSNGNNNDR